MEVGVPWSTMQDHMKKNFKNSQNACHNFKSVDTMMYVVCCSTHSKILLSAETLSRVKTVQFITVLMTEIFVLG
jgi:hypothetical protein